MKKKLPPRRSLSLSRETLRYLSGDQLELAGGAMTVTFCAENTCDCTRFRGCTQNCTM
jgi:hypothetical protein